MMRSTTVKSSPATPLYFLQLFFFSTAAFLLALIPLCLGDQDDTSSCDWSLWDSTLEVKSVHTVSFTCSEGHLLWNNPYGGLRIEFHPPRTSSPHASGASSFSSSSSVPDKYEVCFEAESFHAALQLSMETSRSLMSLAVLNAANPKTEKPFCFKLSRDSLLTLYIEVDSSATSLTNGKLALIYDIRELDLSINIRDTELEECRPCTDAEIAMAACTADFAIVGRMHSVNEDVKADKTVIDVDVTHLLRQRLNILTSSSETSSFRPDSIVDSVRNYLGLRTPSLRSQNTRIQMPKSTFVNISDFSRLNTAAIIDDRLAHLMGEVLSGSAESDDVGLRHRRRRRETSIVLDSSAKDEDSRQRFVSAIYTPRECDVKHGVGHFLFTGRVRLHKAHLQCAPRLEDFIRIWSEAEKHGSNPCTLD